MRSRVGSVFIRGALILCALLLAAGASNSADAVYDTWNDGTDADPASPTYSENGVDVDSDGDVESAWFQGGVGSLNPIGVNGPLVGSTHNPDDGPNPSVGSSTWTTYFKPAGQAIALANVGDGLRVTWKFSVVGVNAGNVTQGFRFGVVDSDARLASNGTPGSTIYAGYGMWANMGSVLGHSNAFQLRERTLTTEGTLFNLTADFGSLLGNGAGAGLAGYSSGVEYTMTWLMTRGLLDTLDIDVSITGGTLGDDGIDPGDGTIRVTAEDITPNTFQFDTFAVRSSSEATTATQFLTSSFRVEFIPEPSGLACGVTALAALAGVVRRRRTG